MPFTSALLWSCLVVRSVLRKFYWYLNVTHSNIYFLVLGVYSGLREMRYRCSRCFGKSTNLVSIVILLLMRYFLSHVRNAYFCIEYQILCCVYSRSSIHMWESLSEYSLGLFVWSCSFDRYFIIMMIIIVINIVIVPLSNLHLHWECSTWMR